MSDIQSLAYRFSVFEQRRTVQATVGTLRAAIAWRLDCLAVYVSRLDNPTTAQDGEDIIREIRQAMRDIEEFPERFHLASPAS